jgi:AraC family transcriptional regulator, transcriptional activator of pobA
MKEIYEIENFDQGLEMFYFTLSKNKHYNIYRLEDVSTPLNLHTPLFRQHFFDITLFEDISFEYNYGTENFNVGKYTLQLVAPYQLQQIIIGKEEVKAMKGYTCTFTKEFISSGITNANFVKDFPFFKLGSVNNIIPLNDSQVEILLPVFRKLKFEQDNNVHAKAEEIIRSYIWILVHECLRIYNQQPGVKSRSAAKYKIVQLADDFQELVDTNYKKITIVEQYASLLHITPNHLTQTIKEVTGKTPKDFITERRLMEAKCLLQYTQNTISEISCLLNFSEPTHFIKFFRKETGKTPLEFRLQKL